MKIRKRYILCLILIGIFSLSFLREDNFIDLEADTILKDNNSIAVYIENDTDYERVDSIPDSGYEFNSSKSYCNESEVKNDHIKINYDVNTKQISITPIISEKTKCYLYFDEKKPTVSEAILANVTVNSGTPDFSQVATTDEGVFQTDDGMYGGTSYYFRGAVENNYVTFGGFCWRIVRINGDGSVRLIYDGATCHANGTTISINETIVQAQTVYSVSDDKAYYAGWSYDETQHGKGTDIYAKTKVESWYNDYLASYDNQIADGKFCNDREVRNGDTWSASGSPFIYAARVRVYTNKIPNLSCNQSDVFTTKIALITTDEVMFAGGIGGTANSSYYLYSGYGYWTMSPSYYTTTYNSLFMFYVNSEGRLADHFVHNNNGKTLRPVINIRYDITISSGDGSLSTPYVIN